MRKLIIALLLIVFVYLPGFCEQEIETSGPIKPNDTLQISVAGQPDLSKTVIVSPEGTIRYPSAGELTVKGLSAGEAGNFLREFFKKYYFADYDVSVVITVSAQGPQEISAAASFSETSEPSNLPVAQPQESSEELFPPSRIPTYKVSPYDVLNISVYGESDFAATVKVSEEGTIRYTLLGEIGVAGLTAEEITKKIEGLLKKGYLLNPQVTVIIEEHGKVSVFGEVIQPGSYELKGPLTLVDVIVLAGGLKENANPSKIKVIRVFQSPSETKPIREYIVDLDIQGKDFYLQPLDKIIIDKYGSIYVVGAIKNPGVFKLEKVDLTPYDAITFLAGGPLSNANLSQVTVIRDEKGAKKEYVFNLAAGQKDKFFLKEEDRILVPLYKNISVFGQVKRSGSYPYTPDMTVTEAISLAGGFTDVADTNAVKVVREGEKKKKTIKVPVGYILKTGDKSRDLPLQDGDTVVVPESWL
ncbi:MAG: polysaccharide biosynthesis/export family protein [Candidatus Omnitrophica bacterium]|nr:polysaccharide biosynthesis/export family protein [Candidatus Omnitrophota bacterium]